MNRYVRNDEQIFIDVQKSRAHAPVSYTHLDVYKRQLAGLSCNNLNCMNRIRIYLLLYTNIKTFCIFAENHDIHILKWSFYCRVRLNRADIGIQIILSAKCYIQDVYKRQISDCSTLAGKDPIAAFIRSFILVIKYGIKIVL